MLTDKPLPTYMFHVLMQNLGSSFSSDQTLLGNLANTISVATIQSVLPQNTSSYDHLDQLLTNSTDISNVGRLEFYEAFADLVDDTDMSEISGTINYLDNLDNLYAKGTTYHQTVLGYFDADVVLEVISETGSAEVLYYIDQLHDRAYGSSSGLISLSKDEYLEDDLIHSLGFTLEAFTS